MSSIASSATSVLISHIAAHTTKIRLGAGGIMLPNHAPLTIAEQFGTLETLHPGRIDLGLGRAPGSDQKTMQALRRDPSSSDSFPQDVLELSGLTSATPRVSLESMPVPGKGTHVPLYILGSSLFAPSSPRCSACRMHLPRTSPPNAPARRRRNLPARVQAVGAASGSRTSSPASTSSPPRRMNRPSRTSSRPSVRASAFLSEVDANSRTTRRTCCSSPLPVSRFFR